VPPLGRHLVLGGDGVDWTRFDAGVAVDALLGVDVELVGLVEAGLVGRGMNAIDRANLDARDALGADARLVDYVRHGRSVLAHGQPLARPLPLRAKEVKDGST
jgi:hypothetical protein